MYEKNLEKEQDNWKEIKVRVNDEVLTLLLDPQDNLKDIRKMFIEDGKLEKLFTNSGNNENKNNFKFRWSSDKFVSDNEIDNNDLNHILVNGSRLYISTLQKNKVTIYTGPREGPRRSFRCILDKGAFLSNIRKELENDFIEQLSVQNVAFLIRKMVRKAKIDISKNNISATPEFIKDVEEALEGETHASLDEHTKSEESNTAAKIESEYVKAKFVAVLKTLHINKATIHKTTHSYTIK
ncbi:hypothetical protein F8M41_009596 [Gigaspora margarita]|uniref:Uncharacterized protein n=1 Tax=Gigaspora margarita TaxID=4874 RepID=A0A8H4AUY9_GIGMA|nr:hypothetical protein F8M41_009596 [Gigaspora margarita]